MSEAQERFSNDYIDKQVEKFFQCDMTFSEIGQLIGAMRSRIGEGKRLQRYLEVAEKRELQTKELLLEVAALRGITNTRGLNILGLARVLLDQEQPEQPAEPAEPVEIAEARKATSMMPKGTRVHLRDRSGSEHSWVVGEA